MSPLDEIPAPWRGAMENAGTYSLRDLATRAGVGTTTVSDLIYGRKRTSERTLQAVAKVLRQPITTTREWAAQARGEIGPWTPPAAAAQLSDRQRKALDELIRAIVTPAAERPGLRAVDRPDLAHPPLPDLSRAAARKGTSEGKRRRRQQDDDAQS